MGGSKSGRSTQQEKQEFVRNYITLMKGFAAAGGFLLLDDLDESTIRQVTFEQMDHATLYVTLHNYPG